MNIAPAVASFDITYRCNLSCVMCHTWPKGRSIGREQELSADEVIIIARRLFDHYGVKVFRFLGGEPLVRDDLTEIVRGVSSFATTLITTNGLTLNEPTCRGLIDAGLAGISVSLDGPRENCDALRGQHVYDRVVNGLKTMARVKREFDSPIEVKLGNIVTRLNLHRMEEVAEFAHELGVDWHLWPMTHLYDHAKATNWNGTSCGIEHPDPELASKYMLDAAELQAFWKEYYRLARRFGKFGSQKMKQGWLGPLKQVVLHRTLSPFIYRDCRRIGRHLIISPNGEINPCEFLRPISLGNVLDRTQDIWRTPTRIELEKVARERRLPVCRECHRLALYRRHL